ncbi:MAG: hypothetical protein ABL897_08845, partial [Hyphomicrobium sp.]
MHIFFGLHEMVARVPDDGVGGGLAAAAAAVAPPVATPPVAPPVTPAAAAVPPTATPPATPPAAAYVPEGLPDTLKGATEKETIDKLWGDLKARSKPPAKVEDYTYETPAELNGIIDAKTDPVLPLFSKVAHKHNLSQEQYTGLVTDLFGEMTKAGMIEKPIDINVEFIALSDGQGDRSAQIASGQRAVLELKSNIDALV